MMKSTTLENCCSTHHPGIAPPRSGFFLTCSVLLFLFIIFHPLTSPAQGKQIPGARHKMEKNNPEQGELKGLDPAMHQDENGIQRPDLYQQSADEFLKMKSAAMETPSSSITWELAGPAPEQVNDEIGKLLGPGLIFTGRVVDLAIDPSGNTDLTLYAATSNGGIWKTTDGGNIWQPKTDALPISSFGAIALDPVNPQLVYAGSGYVKDGGYYAGDGVFISTDGGETWNQPSGDSVLNGTYINKIIVPAPGTIIVASGKGLYRSTDGGKNYTSVAISNSTTSEITDLDMQEGNPEAIWACVNGTGIFFSKDMGASFGNNLWDSLTGKGPSLPYAFVSLGVSAYGQTLYANAGYASANHANKKSSTPRVGFWKSTNAGQEWTDVSANATKPVKGLQQGYQVNSCQLGFDQVLTVDPENSNRVYMGFQNVWLSEDGAGSWTNVSYSRQEGVEPYTVGLLHVDQHALIFSPPSHRGSTNSPKLWAGNDGGIYYTTDAGFSWVTCNAGTKPSLATNLVRGIDIGRGPGNNQWTYAGMQDTGTGVYKPGLADSLEWSEWLGGDGGDVAVDWNHPEIAYGMWDSGIDYTHDGGASFEKSSFRIQGKKSVNFSILEVNPVTGIPYLGGSYGTHPAIFSSSNQGQLYSVFYQWPDVQGAVTSLALTPADSGCLFVSHNYGVQKLTDSSGTITVGPAWHSGGISGQIPMLAANQEDANMVVAVYAGYSGEAFPEPSKHVWLSTNGGSVWNDISGSVQNARIPDMPVYSAVFDPNTSPASIIVSTDFGVYRTTDLGINWHALGTGLPHVPAVSLAIDATVNPSVLRVGTYGRSVWQTVLNAD